MSDYALLQEPWYCDVCGAEESWASRDSCRLCGTKRTWLDDEAKYAIIKELREEIRKLKAVPATSNFESGSGTEDEDEDKSDPTVEPSEDPEGVAAYQLAAEIKTLEHIKGAEALVKEKMRMLQKLREEKLQRKWKLEKQAKGNKMQGHHVRPWRIPVQS